MNKPYTLKIKAHGEEEITEKYESQLEARRAMFYYIEENDFYDYIRAYNEKYNNELMFEYHSTDYNA